MHVAADTKSVHSCLESQDMNQLHLFPFEFMPEVESEQARDQRKLTL